MAYRKKTDIEQVVRLEKGGITYCYTVHYRYKGGYKECIEYANFRDGAIRDITEFKGEWLPVHVQKFLKEHDETVFMTEDDFTAYKYRVDKP